MVNAVKVRGGTKGLGPFVLWVVRALAALGALTLVTLTAAAFLAYLRPEAVMDFGNRFYLCY